LAFGTAEKELPQLEDKILTMYDKKLQIWDDCLTRPQQRKMDIKLEGNLKGTDNIGHPLVLGRMALK
jgi:hypothetical protein